MNRNIYLGWILFNYLSYGSSLINWRSAQSHAFVSMTRLPTFNLNKCKILANMPVGKK